MKTINSFIFLPCLIILLFVTPVFGSSDEWVEFGKDNDGSVLLYNKVTMKHIKKNIVHVWYKYVYSDEGREKFIQDLSIKGLSTEGYDKLSHNMYLHEIDCKKKRMRLLSFAKYDTDDKILFIHSYDKPRRDYIIPNTITDNLRKKVCK